METTLFENEKEHFYISEEKLFIDHSRKKESGHLGHGLVQCEDGKIIAFYPQCSGQEWSGHTAHGHAKYKLSFDYGASWSKGFNFPFSKQLYDLNIGVYSSVEKVVKAKNGDIIAFNFIGKAP